MKKICETREHTTAVIIGVRLSIRDRRLLERWTAQQRSLLEIEQLDEGVRIRTNSWVGVAEFDAFEVRVRPKLVGSEDVLIDMLVFASQSLDVNRYAHFRRYADHQNGTLLELFSILLLHACDELVRGGLLTDYVEREEALPAVRGRMLFERQVLERFGMVDQIYCRHDERAYQIPENQLLALALALCHDRVHHPTIKQRLRRVLKEFLAHTSLESLDLNAVRRELTYHRLNEHYRNAHSIAWVILDALGIDDYYAVNSMSGGAFFINMNTLFERFVEQLIREVLPENDFGVQTQFSDHSIIRNLSGRNAYRAIRPDILVRNHRNTRAKLAVDAKYKLYEQRGVSTADIYQTFFYAHAYRSDNATPRALIVYPATEFQSEELEIRDANGNRSARVYTCGVSIQKVLADSIHEPTGEREKFKLLLQKLLVE